MPTHFSIDELSVMNSKPLGAGQGLAAAEVSGQLAALPEWHLEKGAIARQFKFANYYETMAFVNALAWIVHRQDHHPDLAVSYDTVAVRFNTHSVDGISINDFICAAKAERLFGQRVKASS